MTVASIWQAGLTYTPTGWAGNSGTSGEGRDDADAAAPLSRSMPQISTPLAAAILAAADTGSGSVRGVSANFTRADSHLMSCHCPCCAASANADDRDPLTGLNSGADDAQGASVTSAAATAAVSIDTIAAYLTNGYWSEVGSIQHSFDTATSNSLTVNLSALSAADQALARAALDAWEMVADLSFREVTTSADIGFDDSSSGAFANVYFWSDGDISDADVNVSSQWSQTYGTAIGGYTFQTYLHEIGHALGLGHAGNYSSTSGTNYANDSWQASVMSYNSQTENSAVDASFAYLTTAMSADILAIQRLYGAASGGATAGTTTYGAASDLGNYLDAFFRSGGMSRNALTIYDEGGTDTIDFSLDGKAQNVNLNGGTFSNVFGLTGNLGIAKGTWIENYKSGAGADKIVGNGASNTIYSNAANDSVWGEGGNDTLWFGEGNDAGYGGTGNDTLNGGNLNDRLYGGNDRDTLNGDAGGDALYGDAGNDILIGGSDNDSLDGGIGNDTLYGGANNDVLRGSTGNDWLSGGSGSDVLDGGTGADVFIFSGGTDVIKVFENNIDEVRMDDALWGGRSLSVDQVANSARVVSGDMVFDFGNGNKLVIDNFTNIWAIKDDLIIY